jgi:hypothetical protein
LSRSNEASSNDGVSFSLFDRADHYASSDEHWIKRF